MRILTLFLLLLIVNQCRPTPAPAEPPPSAPMAVPPAAAIVADWARWLGVPQQVAMEVWWKECRNLQLGEGRCRNTRKEHGAWQFTEAAAAVVKCDWQAMAAPENFAYSMVCALKLLKRLEARCRRQGFADPWTAAQGAYNTGRCTVRTAYVVDILARREG